MPEMRDPRWEKVYASITIVEFRKHEFLDIQVSVEYEDRIYNHGLYLSKQSIELAQIDVFDMVMQDIINQIDQRLEASYGSPAPIAHPS